MSSPSPSFSNTEAKNILTEYQRRKQLNSQLGQRELYENFLKWASKTTADKFVIKQAFENLKLTNYREWKKSFDEVDNKPDAKWRDGVE